MPSSGKKHKHPQHSKKSKAIQRQQEGVNRTVRPVTASPPALRETEVSMSSPPRTAVREETRATAAMEYPYLRGELKQIGILAAAIIIILIVLALVLG